MGGVKAMWMKYQESEPMSDWISENYGDIGEEKESKKWEEAVNAFENFCEEQWRLEQEQQWQEEYDYYITQTIADADDRLEGEIRELRSMITHMPDPGFSDTFSKMIYAHAVTVLEVYLEDVAKALILSSDQHLRNTITNVRPFCTEKYKLSEISFDEDGIKKFVLGKLSDSVFHNIPRALAIIGGVVEKNLIQTIDIEDIQKVTLKRHDIVHRNGKNRDGESIDISMKTTTEALYVIESFTKLLRTELTALNLSHLSVKQDTTC